MRTREAGVQSSPRPGVQKEGHPPTPPTHAFMTSPRPLRSDRGNTRRVLLWSIIALVVLTGIMLYFRYGTQPVPLIDQVR